MKKLTYILVLLLITAAKIAAQQHPVQVNVTLQPPYSLRLSDYVAPGTDRINTIVTLNDLNRPTYQARLRLTIEGVNITLRTRDNFLPPPIQLQGGVPLYLTAPELEPYFNPQNIDFLGFTRREYEKNGRLPEGLYRVCIEVLDYERGNVVSNQGCTMAWMMLNDPPLLNMPQNGTKVLATEPQNLMFQWTPRHMASPNAARSVEYLFRLVEVYPEGRNPMEAMRVSRPIYETYTTNTSIYYGPAEPYLIPGRWYAWQVQARDTEGRDLFKNQGYSEVYSFKFGDACLVPGGVVAETINDKTFRLSWEPQLNHTAFQLEYRPKGSAGEWYTLQSFLNYSMIDGLVADTEYEYRMKGYCGTIPGAYSETARIRTPEAEASEFVCGTGEQIQIDNQQPKMMLFEGQTINARGFDIRLTMVTGGNGTFSGEGYATIPFLSFAKLRVSFENIFVNEENQMVRGTIRTVYNPDSPMMLDGDKIQEQLFPARPQQPSFGDDFEGDTIHIEERIVSVDISEDGKDILILTESNTIIKQSLDEEEDVLIVDSEGNETIVRGDGTIEKPTGPIAKGSSGGTGDAPSADNPELKDLELPLVNFGMAEDQKYGFDRQEQQALAGKYETTEIRGSPYSVPWKSVESGRIDNLQAVHEKIKDKDATGEIKFRTLAANYPGMKAGEGEYRLSVTGSFQGNEEELFAVYVQKDIANDKEEETQLGKLKVVTYDKEISSLVIVPVNDHASKFNLVAVRAQVNKIYGQAVAEFDVVVEQPVQIDADEWDQNGDGALNDDKQVSNYTKEMNQLVKAYERAKAQEVNKDAYYIFLMDQSEKGRQGYMPYKQQVGFIFTKNINSTDDLSKTIAHELGHGAFHLKHNFEEYALSQGTTSNLMDYSQGAHLNKYQWDEVHNPKARMNLFKGDEEFAYDPWSSLEGDVIAEIPGFQGKKKTFLSVAGEPITLPENSRDFTFYNGYLAKFTIEGIRWISLVKGNSEKHFVGYFADAKKVEENAFDIGSSHPYEGQLSSAEDVKIMYALKSGSGCGQFAIFEADYVKPVSELKNNGGIGLSSKFYSQNQINNLKNHLENHIKVVENVSEEINCLSGRAKEFYKFVIEHYDFYNQPLSAATENELISALSRFKAVFIKHLDGDESSLSGRTNPVRIREMMSYGVENFLAELKKIEINDSDNPETLVVEFEDYNRIKDAYLLYSIYEDLDADCALFEQLRNEINKQVEENGTVSFNLEFFTALTKSGYELINGNEIFELLSCLLENLKIPEKIYNPNRIDNVVRENLFTVLEDLFEINPDDLLANIAYDYGSYPLACSCGAWNSLVDILKGLSDLAAGLTSADLVSNVKNFSSQIFSKNGISSISSETWKLIKEHHGYVEGYGFDSYQATYGTCYDVVFVASFFVGIGELNAISKAAKAGDVGEIAMIIIRSAKNTPAAWANLAKTLTKFPDKLGRKIILEIVEKAPESVIKVVTSSEIVKVYAFDAALNKQIQLFELTVEGFRSITSTANVSGKVTNVIYESSDLVTDISTGKKGYVKILQDEYGNVYGVIDDAEALTLTKHIDNLYNKNIRSAIIGSPESRVVALKYFNKIKQNPSNYLEGFTAHLDNFDDWFEVVFKSDLFEAHHVIPKNVLRDNTNLHQILDWARKNGEDWDFGGIDNGVMLQKRRKNIVGDIVGDHANHPQYDIQISSKIDGFFVQNSGDMSAAFHDLVEFVDDLKIQISNDVIEGNNIINTITVP